jgi:hypothetical protein
MGYMEDEDNIYNEEEEEITKMFSSKKNLLSSDEELALHIFYKFNIDRDTMESMPAFEEKIKTLFGREKEK